MPAHPPALLARQGRRARREPPSPPARGGPSPPAEDMGSGSWDTAPGATTPLVSPGIGPEPPLPMARTHLLALHALGTSRANAAWGAGGAGSPITAPGTGGTDNAWGTLRESRGMGWGRPTGRMPWPHNGVSPKHQLPLRSSRSILKNDLSPSSVTEQSPGWLFWDRQAPVPHGVRLGAAEGRGGDDGCVPPPTTHPVSFLPLVSFGSLLPVESPVTLGGGRCRQWGTTGSSPRTVPEVPMRPQGPHTSPRSHCDPTLGPMSPSFPGTPGTPDSPSSPCGTKQTSVSPRRASPPPHTPVPPLTGSPFLPGSPERPGSPGSPYSRQDRGREGVRAHLWGHPQQGTLSGVGVRAQPSLLVLGWTEGPHSVGTHSPSPPCPRRGRRRL